MPVSPPRFCTHPGCSELVSSGRCPVHEAQRQRAIDERRGSSSSRGYDVRWQRFRAAYIRDVVAEDPFCLDCRRPFQRPSEIELHHVKKLAEHHELKYERSNIRHLCARCHKARTARGE